MTSTDLLAAEFETHRERLRGMAYRLLGSAAEAEDAVQEAWLRLVRSDAATVHDLGGWLTTVVARVCLVVLRSGRRRREEPLVSDEAGDVAGDPLDEAVMAEAVDVAPLVVLQRLSPRERVAFVLHDVFAVPFAEVARVVDRSPGAAKKLASRARQRIRGAAPLPHGNVRRQRRVLEAFLAAARGGDVAALLAVLASDVVRHADAHALPVGAPLRLRGAEAVVEETRGNCDRARWARVALVDGVVGAVVAPAGRLRVVLQPTIVGDRITRLDVVADPARLAGFDIALLDL